jgi:hypothetical protein
MSRIGSLWLVGVVCLVCAAPLKAQGLPGPDWRGQPGSSYQALTFDSGANPESVPNHFGDATATIVVGPYGTGWYNSLPGLGTRTGFWDLGSTGGQIEILVDNWSEPYGPKEVWVQVTCFKDIMLEPTTVLDVSGQPECAVTFLGSETALVEHVPTGGDWLVLQSRWRIDPNPAQERIVVRTHLWGSIIDQVVVDTLIVLFCDVNRDASVDVVDLLYLVDAFGSVEGDATYDARCDFNADGSVDVVDLLYMVENFGRTIP